MSRGMKACLSGLVIVSITWFGRDVWLGAVGRYLTSTGGGATSSADFAVVPPADYIRPDVGMETLEEAVRLQRGGSVKRIVMSCREFYGVSECELAETALRSRGYLGARIEWLRTEPLPDEMEAVKTIQYLWERGAKSAIILLPNYKVRRLGRVFRSRIEWLRTEPLPDEMEAVKTIQYLWERGAKSAIILLPNYKVRRLGRVY